ncbi:uncharacterized protein LOC126674579 [Mercurialis annua]|uniref:uncharacterized protein LOC126674579 n=1 Tax=Mercurialis annua TaxID=3986 RepID=UPI0021606370|nr:uncharacterized protein LOC126674579 [Mercurialis annua]
MTMVNISYDFMLSKTLNMLGLQPHYYRLEQKASNLIYQATVVFVYGDQQTGFVTEEMVGISFEGFAHAKELAAYTALEFLNIRYHITVNDFNKPRADQLETENVILTHVYDATVENYNLLMAIYKRTKKRLQNLDKTMWKFTYLTIRAMFKRHNE